MKINLTLVMLLLLLAAHSQVGKPINTYKGNSPEQKKAKSFFHSRYREMKYVYNPKNVDWDGRDKFTMDSAIFYVKADTFELALLFYYDLIDPHFLKDDLYESKSINPEYGLHRVAGKSDTFYISKIERLNFIEPSRKVRRFSFVVNSPMLRQPALYFCEIKNKRGKRDTALIDFARRAELTFLEKGWDTE